MNEDFLERYLDERIEQNSLRTLRLSDGIDFCSNDYLGIVANNLINVPPSKHGSTGSRLLTGNSVLVEQVERDIASFHRAEAGLIFNSGYDANLGLLACVARRGDTILYDEYSHASIRDGIRLSFAQSHSFAHNQLHDLEKKLQTILNGEKFVVTESVFSMDGHLSPLTKLVGLCDQYSAHLIIDEAHATGIIGENGEGVVQHLGLEKRVFARVHTFGKALGVHGAIVLGSEMLRNYLINFSRPFIYTTALSETSILAIRAAYDLFPSMTKEREQIQSLTTNFSKQADSSASDTAIQGWIIPGNSMVKKVSKELQQSGFDVRPILYPTVPKGQERLRIVLHSFNTADQLSQLIQAISTSVNDASALDRHNAR